MKNIVYKITNTINNKFYFGVTQQTLKKRWQQHKCNSNRKSYHLYNAIKKYGFKNFNIELVFEFNTKKEMLDKEIELISLHKTYDRMFGYNNSTGGESSRKGCKLTQEQKNKISEYQKKRIRKPHSEETKKAIGLANKNKIRSEEFKKRLSEIKKGCEAKNKKKVILNDEFIFNSITEASIKTGVGISSICNNIKGLSKTTKIGIWKVYQHEN